MELDLIAWADHSTVMAMTIGCHFGHCKHWLSTVPIQTWTVHSVEIVDVVLVDERTSFVADDDKTAVLAVGVGVVGGGFGGDTINKLHYGYGHLKNLNRSRNLAIEKKATAKNVLFNQK